MPSTIDDSVSTESRMRQFGLYRTIDARTEEFLRQSRKRQIRQGCACAAASTAITVTIVIVVFFVYEFSLNSSTQLEKSLKYNLFNLMNGTSEDSSFDPKLTKTSIDRETIKLLPILIGAIKKNAALEKFLDDNSSSSLFYDEKDTNEGLKSKENFYTKGWLKLPTTKLFAIEYKTSPVVYYKNPTKSIDQYTKIRKIRDYQRVINYVDKMISDKVYIRSSRPMQLNLFSETTTKTIFKKTNKALEPVSKTFKRQNKKANNTSFVKSCECHQHFDQILNKILYRVHKFIHETKNSECDKNKTLPKTAQTNLLNVFSYLTKLNSTNSSGGPVKHKKLFHIETELETKDTLDKLKHKYDFDETTPTPNLSANKIISHNSTSLLPKLINQYKDIVYQQQVLSNQDQKFTKSETLFDGIEYDDFSSFTSTPKTNNINYVKTKHKYFNDYDVVLQNKKTNKKSLNNLEIKNKPVNLGTLKNMYKKNIQHRKSDLKEHKIKNRDKYDTEHISSRKNVYFLRDKSNTDKKILYGKGNKLNAQLSELNNMTTANKLIFEKFFKSKPSPDYLENDKKSDISVLALDKINNITPESSYFHYSTNSQYNGSILDLLKNSVYTFLTDKLFQNKTFNFETKMNLKRTETESVKNRESIKNNNTAIQRFLQNHANALLSKNIMNLKTNAENIKSVSKESKKYKLPIINVLPIKPLVNITPIENKIHYNKIDHNASTPMPSKIRNSTNSTKILAVSKNFKLDETTTTTKTLEFNKTLKTYDDETIESDGMTTDSDVNQAVVSTWKDVYRKINGSENNETFTFSSSDVKKKVTYHKEKLGVSGKGDEFNDSELLIMAITEPSEQSKYNWTKETQDLSTAAVTTWNDSFTNNYKSNNDFSNFSLEFNDKNNLMHEKEKLRVSDPENEDSDLLVMEITKSPENALYTEPRYNLTEKKQDTDLTWEDLTNAFMPAWRSIIPDPEKPVYLGHHNINDKQDENYDYNINSNFYDLNL